jgi:UV DNA damage endonuclease
MKIGYPCINRTIGCSTNRTFRLKSYSEERLIETVEDNLDCLLHILKFNIEHNILFFRITSDLVPFASHPICQFPWQKFFEDKFREIGNFIRSHGIRISMHPDQFTLINSPNLEVYEDSIRELLYHSQVLGLMKLGSTAKIQIHVGGVYRDKERSMERFIKRFWEMEDIAKKHLVIENDDKNYTLRDCVHISSETGIPVLFDSFHHELNNDGGTIQEAFGICTNTWSTADGLPMVDYSSQEVGQRRGKHAESLDVNHFREFLEQTRPLDFDVMLEIKDKERSAFKALEIGSQDDRVRGFG